MTVSVVTPLRGTSEDFVIEATRAMDNVLSLDAGGLVSEWEVVIDGDTRDLSTVFDLVRASNRRRVQIIRLSDAHGISGAKNVGVKYSESEYISWFDADDSLDPQVYLEYLHLAVDSLGRDKDCVSVFSSHWDCASDLRPIALRNSSAIFRLHQQLAHTPTDPALFIDVTYHAQVLRRQDFLDIGGFLGPPDIGEDVRLTHRLMRLTPASYLSYSDLVPYFYRRNPAGITRGRKAELRKISTSDFRSMQKASGVLDHESTTHQPASIILDGQDLRLSPPAEVLPEYNTYLPELTFDLKWLNKE